jgi:tRNA(fMet)-specific endonuclease VapC
MKYLLDTDHLSILQRKAGKDYQNLSRRMADYLLSDFTVSTITFHEQILGCHSFINRARNLTDVVKGHEIMTRLINDFKILPLLPFDTNAAIIFNQIQS